MSEHQTYDFVTYCIPLHAVTVEDQRVYAYGTH